MIRTIFKPVIAKTLFFLLSLFTVFSFSSKAGGIVFEIFLNNKLLLKQQYGKIVEGSATLQLANASNDDNLRINFSSCHATGKTRSVGIRNENNKLLKEWVFPNTTSSSLSMTIPVKEILALQKDKSAASLTLLASVLPDKKSTVYQRGVIRNNLPILTAGVLTLGALGFIIRKKV